MFLLEKKQTRCPLPKNGPRPKEAQNGPALRAATPPCREKKTFRKELHELAFREAKLLGTDGCRFSRSVQTLTTPTGF
jgi:hypothetical protein